MMDIPQYPNSLCCKHSGIRKQGVAENTFQQKAGGDGVMICAPDLLRIPEKGCGDAAIGHLVEKTGP